jgi:hypothetical protein
MGTLIVNPYLNSQPSSDFILTIDSSKYNPADQIILPIGTTGTYNYSVDWGDGTVENNITVGGNRSHIYASGAGIYTITISGKISTIEWWKSGDYRGVLSITDLGAVGWDTLARSFENCWRMTEITNPGDTSNVTNFSQAWFYCSGLTSFPLLDSSNVTDFSGAWFYCYGLTSFPLLDSSNVTDFTNAWYYCSGLTSFPLLDSSKVTNFTNAWRGCSGLTSFPANFFDNWVGVPVDGCFRFTWSNCSSLTAQSVENILVSIDTSGVMAPTGSSLGNRYIEISYNVNTGNLSSATLDAIDNLKEKNWEPFINGALV